MLTVDKTIREFVDALESKEPTPGGGSASALAGSLGAALTSMVGNLSFGKKSYESLDEDIKEEFKRSFNEMIEIKDNLYKYIDKDMEAFQSYMDVFKMPRDTEEEKEERKKAMKNATIEALEVPLATSKECLKILKLQKVFAEHGNINAITDVGVATLMAYAAVEGSLFNVLINLKGLKDQAYIEEIQIQYDSILDEAKKLKEEILTITYKKLK